MSLSHRRHGAARPDHQGIIFWYIGSLVERASDLRLRSLLEAPSCYYCSVMPSLGKRTVCGLRPDVQTRSSTPQGASDPGGCPHSPVRGVTTESAASRG